MALSGLLICLFNIFAKNFDFFLTLMAIALFVIGLAGLIWSWPRARREVNRRLRNHIPVNAIRTLQSFDSREGVFLSRRDGALKATMTRHNAGITITLPETALEWFVDVVDTQSGLRVSDWQDYVGYGASYPEQLDREMAGDIARFLDSLLTRQLRCVPTRSPDKCILEWLVEGVWRQAVPFSMD
jgi:hypothetical protein